MSDTGTLPGAATRPHTAKTASGLLTALSMMFGRGPAARAMVDLAGLTTHNLIVDIGCGPGAAARAAAPACDSVTGVDPAPMMLRLGRWLTASRQPPRRGGPPDR
jgi:SAM-dependent methyltransferase